MTLTYLTMAIVAAVVLQAAVAWRLLRGLRQVDRLDVRIGHLTEALRLLAETTEAGFRASATELARVAERGSAEAAATSPSATSETPATPATVKNRSRASRPQPRRVANAQTHAVPAKAPAASVEVQANAPISAADGAAGAQGSAASSAPVKSRRQAPPVRKPRAAIASVAQEMSESEARLRLLLAEKSAADAAREANRGTLRA